MAVNGAMAYKSAALILQSSVQAGVNLQWLWYSRWDWRMGQILGRISAAGPAGSSLCVQRTALPGVSAGLLLLCLPAPSLLVSKAPLST